MRKLLIALPVLAVLALPTRALADGTIRSPGDHPDYHVDIEPHGILGWGFGWGPVGVGGGVRFSIPVCKNCFVPKINNNVAISFGADFAVYPFSDYYGASPSFVFLPVALQWNFFVARKWSVGAEPGVTPWVGIAGYDNYCREPGCHNWFIWPSLAVVARYHFNEHVALTMRAGFPEFFNLGVSFWL
jgi:hypothetical protein